METAVWVVGSVIALFLWRILSHLQGFRVEVLTAIRQRERWRIEDE